MRVPNTLLFTNQTGTTFLAFSIATSPPCGTCRLHCATGKPRHTRLTSKALCFGGSAPVNASFEIERAASTSGTRLSRRRKDGGLHRSRNRRWCRCFYRCKDGTRDCWSGNFHGRRCGHADWAGRSNWARNRRNRRARGRSTHGN